MPTHDYIRDANGRILAGELASSAGRLEWLEGHGDGRARRRPVPTPASRAARLVPRR